MARDRAPSFQWYPGDFMSDPEVQSLTWEQVGRYFWAINCSSLTDTPGVASESDWRRWMRYSEQEWEENREAHARCFKIGADGAWIQKRLRIEKKEQRARFMSAKEAGRVSGVERRAKAANGMRTECERIANGMPTPSSSSSLTPSLPVATLREGTRFARADSYEPNTNLKESFLGTSSEHAGASNGASGAPGGRETAAGLCTLGSVLDGIAARLGSQNAQDGPAVVAGSRDGSEGDSEAKPGAGRDPGANAEVREYVAPVYALAKPYGAAIATKTLALCGRLYNAGRRSTIFLQTVARHYVEHRGEIREPEAFYSGKTVGSEGLLMDLAAQSVIAEHQRQAAETGAWLKGSRP